MGRCHRKTLTNLTTLTILKLFQVTDTTNGLKRQVTDRKATSIIDDTGHLLENKHPKVKMGREVKRRFTGEQT